MTPGVCAFFPGPAPVFATASARSFDCLGSVLFLVPALPPVADSMTSFRFSLSTTSIPSTTSRPNTVCLPSRCGVLSNVMKNCDPPVFFPAWAMLRTPRSCFCRSLRSHSHLMRHPGPPRPVPLRVATLDHEAGLHPMKFDPVVELLLHETHKIGHSVRRLVLGTVPAGCSPCWSSTTPAAVFLSALGNRTLGDGQPHSRADETGNDSDPCLMHACSCWLCAIPAGPLNNGKGLRHRPKLPGSSPGVSIRAARTVRQPGLSTIA